MRLVTFTSANGLQTEPRLGALASDSRTVIDLQQGFSVMSGQRSAYLANMLKLLDGGEQAMDEARHVVEFVESQTPPACLYSLNHITLLAPLTPSHYTQLGKPQ
jgi:hypothetical protein